MNTRKESGGAPVYVKVDDYEQVLDVLDAIKKSIGEARKTLHELNTLKEEENAEFQKWVDSLNEIEGRVNDVDKMIFEPESNW